MHLCKNYRSNWLFISSISLVLLSCSTTDKNIPHGNTLADIVSADTLPKVQLSVMPSDSDAVITLYSTMDSNTIAAQSSMGFLLSKDSIPTLSSYDFKFFSSDVDIHGRFNTILPSAIKAGLDSSATYYVRAFSIASSAVSYGNVRSFQLDKYPTFILNKYEEIGATATTLPVVISSDSVIQRGAVAYPESSVHDNSIWYSDANTSSSTSYNADFTTLSPSTFYHVKAYGITKNLDTIYSRDDNMLRTLKSGANTYALNWSDEFNIDGLPSTSDWNYERGFVRNQETQWYQEGNAYQQNGKLILEGRKETKLNPNYVAGSSNWKLNRQYIEYTSSSLTSSGKHSFTYGHFQIKAKIPVGTGSWPAIWSVGYNGDWPENGEIDIMEYYGDRIHANYAVGGTKKWSAVWFSQAPSMETFGGNSWADDYHLWTMDWDADSISVYIDNRLINSQSQVPMYNRTSPYRHPFVGAPQYMFLNLALGGQAGSVTGLTFPLRYLVDYLRVYQTK